MPAAMTAESLTALARRLDASYRPSVPLTKWMGLPVTIDETLPAGVVEIRNDAGAVLARYEVPEAK